MTSEGSNGDSTDGTEQSRDIGRRSILQLAGTGIASLAAVRTLSSEGAAQSTRTLNVSDGDDIGSALSSISDGETVELPEGTYRFTGASISASNFTFRGNGATFDVSGARSLRINGSDWEFGGVNFDVSGEAALTARPNGADWRLHNCAWSGPLDNTNYLIYPQMPEGTTGEIDQCWFGSGVNPDRSESAIFTYKSTDGELWIRRSYFFQNGVYGVDTTNPPGMRGVTNYESCYFNNCYLSCLRAGNNYGKTSTVRDCTIVYDSRDETPAVQSTGVKAFRGIWGFWGDVEVENCNVKNPYGHALVTSSNHGSPHISVSGGAVSGNVHGNVDLADDVGSDPSTAPPEGCVTSPEEAYNGAGQSGNEDSSQQDDEDSEQSQKKALKIEGKGESANYAFSVDGELEPVADTIESYEVVEDNSAEGWVTDPEHVDEYAFSGEITEFTFRTGEANVYVDGDPYAVNGEDRSRLVISGRGTSSNYQFSVDGELFPVGDTIESYEVVEDNSAEGWVTDPEHVDEYEFTGEITEFTWARGEGDATVDGEPLGAGSDEPDRLVVRGNGFSANYQFSVDGELATAGDSIEGWDEVGDTTAEGWVTDPEHTDEFEVTGSVTEFTWLRSEGTILLNGTEVSPDELTGN